MAFPLLVNNHRPRVVSGCNFTRNRPLRRNTATAFARHRAGGRPHTETIEPFNNNIVRRLRLVRREPETLIVYRRPADVRLSGEQIRLATTRDVVYASSQAAAAAGKLDARRRAGDGKIVLSEIIIFILRDR